jgi:translocation and assembly module TamA
VNPGERLKFTKVEVTLEGEGLSDKAFSKYLANLPVKAGDYFNSEYYEEIKDNLQDLANTRGYFQAKFISSKLVVNLTDYTSEVLIVYNTGRRSRFGNTHFSKSFIKESLLERYLVFDAGNYYNSYLIEESRKNLSDSGYFSQVTLTPDLSNLNESTTPINITLTPQNRVTYSFGLGYGTDSGIRGMAGSDIRWLNASGHSLHFQARGSQNNDQLSASYVIPGPVPSISSYSIGGGIMDINQVTGNAKSAQTNAFYRTQLGDWRASTGLVYLIENYTLNDFPTQGENTHTDANVLYPQLTLQRIHAKKDLINPDYGYNITFNTAVGNNFNGNDLFSQSRLDIKTLYTIEKTHTRILTRASLGYIFINDLTNLPLSMQFYAGGAQSIRGFHYNSIGPGAELGIASFELQQKIMGNFYLGGFVDAGNVSNNIFDERPNVGVGPALIYLSPVGAIELSFGRQVSNDSHSWAIQFSMGALL